MASFRKLAVQAGAGLCLTAAAAAAAAAAEQAPQPQVATIATTATISADELNDKLSGFWLGQLVGNFMGLPFEFQYRQNAMPILPEKYYDRAMAEAEGLRVGPGGYGGIPQYLDKMQGAYTDDDTDIEFVTLAAIKEHGLDLTYPEIAKYWQKYVHIKVDGNEALWFANKEARELMDKDLVPPSTGHSQNNYFWWTIDPQLVNELWSALYPGMVDKAVARAEWGAKITSADWGTHPTMWYAALISAAFFENDVATLWDMAASYVPSDSLFLEGLNDVKALYDRGDDWRDARGEIVEKYQKEPEHCGDLMWNCGVSAMINGLLGAIAFLWGQGDFRTTVGIGIAAGYDCDNQAATMGGLMGAMHGQSGIPYAWTHEIIAGKTWDMPFNNRYVNERRKPLPEENTITDIVADIMNWTEAAILQNGGSFDGDNYTVALSGMTGKPAPTPAPPSTDSCCDWCERGSFCSPNSGNCYSWKRKDYYHTCTGTTADVAVAPPADVFYP